jgi:DNA-binding response OmpR family regulator
MSTILVVDDTALARESVSKLLEYEGFRTVKARNGRDAWAAMHHERPDLVLLDLMMPEMDGVTFLAMVRRSPLWRGLPVVVLTGAGDRGHLIRRAWDLKANDLVPKATFGFDELLARVRHHLAAAAARGSGGSAGGASLPRPPRWAEHHCPRKSQGRPGGGATAGPQEEAERRHDRVAADVPGQSLVLLPHAAEGHADRDAPPRRPANHPTSVMIRSTGGGAGLGLPRKGDDDRLGTTPAAPEVVGDAGAVLLGGPSVIVHVNAEAVRGAARRLIRQAHEVSVTQRAGPAGPRPKDRLQIGEPTPDHAPSPDAR